MVGSILITAIVLVLVFDRRYTVFWSSKSRKHEVEIAKSKAAFLVLFMLMSLFIAEPELKILFFLLCLVQMYYLVGVILDNGYAIITDGPFGYDHITRVTSRNYKRTIRTLRKEGASNIRVTKMGMNYLTNEQIKDRWNL